MKKFNYAALLLVVILFSKNAFAEKEPIKCVNPKEAIAYLNLYTEDEGSHKVPKGSVAYVDVLLLSIYGIELVSGIVTRGDSLLVVDDNERWYLDLSEWDCSIPEIIEDKESKWI